MRLNITLGLLLVGSVVSSCKTDVTEVGVADYPPPQAPTVVADVPPVPKAKPRQYGNSIRSGDTLELFVEEDKSFNGTYIVRERGDIIITSLGRIPVSGMSVIDAGAKIKAELESSQLKKATVIVDRVIRAAVPPEPASSGGGVAKKPSQNPRLTVYMSGKVVRPGQHKVPIPANGTLGVYEAILITGGMTRFADNQRVHVLRNGADGQKHRIPVDIRKIEQGLAQDPRIGEGDIVIVPERVFGF